MNNLNRSSHHTLHEFPVPDQAVQLLSEEQKEVNRMHFMCRPLKSARFGFHFTKCQFWHCCVSDCIGMNFDVETRHILPG